MLNEYGYDQNIKNNQNQLDDFKIEEEKSKDYKIQSNEAVFQNNNNTKKN